MPSIIRELHKVLTCGAVIAILAVPGHAASLGLGGVGGVSVGGNGASANVGGASGANADASFGGSSTASIGGTNGANAGVSLGGGQAADAAVSLGGTDTGATTSIGTSGSNVGIGTLGASAGVGVGIPGTPGVPGTPASVTTKPSAAVAQMSGTQLARMKKRSADVLSSEGTYDADLRALCLMISRR